MWLSPELFDYWFGCLRPVWRLVGTLCACLSYSFSPKHRPDHIGVSEVPTFIARVEAVDIWCRWLWTGIDV